MALRFEFDRTNKILLIQVDGRVTDESLTELYQAGRKYSIATDASALIVDFSSVVEFAICNEIVRELARQAPAMPDATRPRIIVAPQTHAFGLFRMFQLMGDSTRPLLTIVRTMEEAFTALKVRSSEFEPLEQNGHLDSGS
jgi:hypothetical protein